MNPLIGTKEGDNIMYLATGCFDLM